MNEGFDSLKTSSILDGGERHAIQLRPMTDDDLPFLKRVYASTRAEEMRLTGWSEDQIEAFITMQFNAQHTHYTRFYPDARFDLIEVDGESVGRLYVDRMKNEIRIMDIALLPEFQKKGIGSRLMRDLLDEGREKQLPVRLHVERNNPALHFYERLGFKVIEDKGVYLFMERAPR